MRKKSKLKDRYLVKAKTNNGQWVAGLLTVMRGQLYVIDADDENTAYLINKDTICQCTSLEDKYGNLIWENDIIRGRYHTYKVIWDNEEGAWMAGTIELDHVPLYGLGGTNSKEYEVTGNIFDNPKLL